MTQATATQDTTAQAMPSMGEALEGLLAMLPSEVSDPMLGMGTLAVGCGLIGITTTFIVSSCMVGVMMTFALSLLALVILALTAWLTYVVLTSTEKDTFVSVGQKTGQAWNTVTGWFSAKPEVAAVPAA